MKRIYHIIFSYCLLLAACKQQKALPSLSETYNKDDKKPFGAYIAYNQFKKLFGDRYIVPTTDPFDKDLLRDDSSEANTYSLFFLLTRNLELTYNEADAMTEFVKEGNDLFIAADYIDMELQAKANFLTEREDELVKEVGGYMHTTSLKMFFGEGFNVPSYKYYYYPFLNSFDGYDSSQTRILGVNEEGKPDFIVLFIGKGRLYLHAAPRSFSNYFLLTGDNYRYFENVLSYLRTQPKYIFWDEYYQHKSTRRKRTNNSDTDENQFSSFNVINKNPPLLWAFWLAVIAIVCYILFNIKRRQKIINEVKANVNTTVTFTETVGRLYLQKKNNKNISEKMITYFYEHIRNSYFLNTTQINNEFINTLAKKSGVEISLTQKLFDTISGIQAKENINDTELLELNEHIQKFYKNKM